jgi:hypothetical protein
MATREIWKLVFGDVRPAPAENFVKLASRVLQCEFDRRGSLAHLDSSNRGDIKTYVDCAVTGPSITRYGETINVGPTERGSQLIKTIRTENGEPADLLTYEHLLVERIHGSTYNIVLVGATGSGKTRRLEYIWERYIKHHAECVTESKCRTGKRVRLSFDLDKRDVKTASHFYSTLYETINAMLRRLDATERAEAYQEFRAKVVQLFDDDADLAYMPTLLRCGIAETDAPSLTELPNACRPDEMRDLVLFILHFCGWLCDTRRHQSFLCLHLCIDNVDASPAAVQEALLSLLVDARPPLSLLIVCACRPQTMRRWVSKRDLLDVIPHIGASAYDIVLRRLKSFLDEPPSDDELADLLQNAIPPRGFLANLAFLHTRLQAEHFREFFDDIFGWHVRDGIVFAQSIVELAANKRVSELRPGDDGRSDYVLERMLFRPWGVARPAGHVPNIYAVGLHPKLRLLGTRVMKAVTGAGEGSLRVKHVWEQVAAFGYSQEDVLDSLNGMLGQGMIVAATREEHTLGAFTECSEERLFVTRTGEGILRKSMQMTYIESCMYECRSESSNYRHNPRLIPTFGDALFVLREFLTETGRIDTAEVREVKKRKQFKRYAERYGYSCIAWDMYAAVMPTVLRIIKAEIRKGVDTYSDALITADRMVSDCLALGKAMGDEGLEIEGQDKLGSALDEIRELAASDHRKTVRGKDA